MGYEFLLREDREGFSILTLNRPDKHNALSIALRGELVSALDDLASSDEIQCVILTGAGGTFCAGFDLKEFSSGNMEEIFADANIYHHKVFTFKKPLIAAINGSALAGGMDLALMCDVRIASDKALFGQPQVRMGVPAAFDLVRTVVPETVAREICLSGRRMDSAEAEKLNLINMAVNAENVMDEAIALARQIVENKTGPMMKEAILKTQKPLFE